MNTNPSLKLTPANAHQYIGYEIRFKTRGTTMTKRILGVSDTGMSITIDHPDLKNCLQIVTRNVYVIIPPTQL
jgi:hypothetical protein